MQYEYSYCHHLFLMDRDLTLEAFTSDAGAAKGYSYSMFSKLYAALTCELSCVEDVFERFHKLEYESLQRFLYRRYNLPVTIIEEFMEKKKLFPNAAIFRWDALAYGDGSIAQFVFSETMAERVKTLLLRK